MVDGSGLENQHVRKGIVGSNPTLSVISFRKCSLSFSKVHLTAKKIERYFFNSPLELSAY